MIKRLFSYLLTFFAIFIISCNDSQAAFIKSDHKVLKFCEKYTMVGSFINAYPRITPAIIALPFIPFIAVSVVPGLVDKPTIIQYICDTLTTVESLSNADAIFYMGTQLNDMTGNKWDKDLEMYSASFSLVNTLWDFENGKSRKGALKSVATHKEINDFMATSYEWYNKRVNGTDATLKTRGQTERDLDSLGSASYKIAMLKDLTNCPTPPDTNVDYQKIYKEKIEAYEKTRDSTQIDINFYQEKLLQMGPKFLSTEKEMNKFIYDVRRLMVAGVTYKTTEKTKTEKTTKKDPKKKDADGNPKKTQVSISRKAYAYKAVAFSEVFEAFLQEHESNWSSWVTNQVISSGSRGLFDNPRARVQQDFLDLNYECRASKIMEGIDTSRPDYDTMLNKKQEQCIENTKTDEKKMQNLFSYYVNQLKTSLLANKSANAEVWTQESWYLGTNRNVSASSEASVPQEQVVCESADKLEYNDQLLIKNKKDAANNELKEIIAKQYMKRNAMKEAKENASLELAKENERKKEFVQKRAEEDKKVIKTPIIPVPFEGRVRD